MTKGVIDVSGYFTDGVVNTSGSYYVPVPASRLVDTRGGLSTIPGWLTTLQIAGQRAVFHNSIPQVLVPPISAVTRAVAALLNITAVPTGPSGYLTAFPAGSASPPSSDVNYAGRAAVPNVAFLKLSRGGLSLG